MDLSLRPLGTDTQDLSQNLTYMGPNGFEPLTSTAGALTSELRPHANELSLNQLDVALRAKAPLLSHNVLGLRVGAVETHGLQPTSERLGHAGLTAHLALRAGRFLPRPNVRGRHSGRPTVENVP